MNIANGGSLLSEHVACTDGHDSGPVVNDFWRTVDCRLESLVCSICKLRAHKALVDSGASEPADAPFKTASSQHIKAWASSKGCFL